MYISLLEKRLITDINDINILLLDDYKAEMEESSRYYYVTPKNSDYSSRHFPRVINWNQNFYIEVDENVEFRGYIELYVGKFAEEMVDKPKSSAYEKVRPILKEIFLDHYLLALKLLNKIEVTEGEFYLISHSTDWFQVEYYSIDRKQKNIRIDFRNSVDSLWLMLMGSSSLRSRATARKNGLPITATQFKQILDLTMKYLFDADSLKVLLLNYIKSFKRLTEGEVDFEIFKIDNDQLFKKIVDRLIQRKQTIEQRLIENDDDPESDRIKMRGEIDGINYALDTIKTG